MLKTDIETTSSLTLFRQIPVRTWILLVIGLIVHLPIVAPQIHSLWNSQHYSFFPFVIAAFAWLLWTRLRNADVQLADNLSKRSLALLTFNTALLALATLENSLWFGWISFLFFLWVAANVLLTPASASLVRAPFFLLVLIVPLPLSLDTSLVIQLQKLATSQGSLLLDYLGIGHSVSGVTIRLPQKTFLIEEACSGINSLFSALATVLAFCIYCQYGFVRTVANMAQTTLWVLVANSIRVCVVVWGYVRRDAGLEDGWRHEALGFAVFGLILLVSLSTDQLIRHFFPPRTMEYGFVPKRKARPDWLRAIEGWFRAPIASRASSFAAFFFAVSFALIGVSGAVQTWRRPGVERPANFVQGLALELAESDLPEEVVGWRRIGFQKINRSQGNALGTNSLVWTYELNGIKAQFSIDGSYLEFHDLSYCYSSTGWRIRHSDNLKLPGSLGGDGITQVVASELQLYRGNSEQAYVLFTCIDSAGQVVPPPAPAETFTRRLMDRLRSGRLLGNERPMPVSPPVIQFQGFAYADSEYFPHERSGIQTLFAALRETVGKKMIASPKPSSDRSVTVRDPMAPFKASVFRGSLQ